MDDDEENANIQEGGATMRWVEIKQEDIVVNDECATLGIEATSIAAPRLTILRRVGAIL